MSACATGYRTFRVQMRPYTHKAAGKVISTFDAVVDGGPEALDQVIQVEVAKLRAEWGLVIDEFVAVAREVTP